MEKIRKSRVEQGLCVGCGSQKDRDGYYCFSCKEKYNMLRHARVNRLRAEGKCSACGNVLDREGWFCNSCTRTLRLRARSRCAERRLNHQCVQCGSSTELGSYCQRCRDMRNARLAKKQK